MIGWIDDATIRALLPMAEAIDAIEAALRDGLDPEAGVARTIVDLPAGQLLLMPASGPRYAGVKVVTVAPANVPRIQGSYLLLDAKTLAPIANLDAIALTNLRTAAVSGVAVRHLATATATRLMVFGTGPQASAHIEAIRSLRPIEHVAVVGRSGGAEFVRRCRVLGLAADESAPDAVDRADIVCCATTAREALFDGARVRDNATVIAIGSHEPTAREVDERLVTRATTVVEARSTALREAGDIIQAGCVAESLHTLDKLVQGGVRVPTDRPRLFKSTGMAWEDLVIASALYERWSV